MRHLKKEYAFQSEVNIFIFREGGLILKSFKDEMDAVNSAVANDQGEGEAPLTLANLQGGFLLWAISTSFIFVIFFTEVLRLDNLRSISKFY